MQRLTSEPGPLVNHKYTTRAVWRDGMSTLARYTVYIADQDDPFVRRAATTLAGVVGLAATHGGRPGWRAIRSVLRTGRVWVRTWAAICRA